MGIVCKRGLARALHEDNQKIQPAYQQNQRDGKSYQLDEVKEAIRVFLNNLCKSQDSNCEIVSVSFWHSTLKTFPELSYSFLNLNDPLSAAFEGNVCPTGALRTEGGTYGCHMQLEVINTGQLSDGALEDEVYGIVQRYIWSRDAASAISVDVVE